VGLTAHAASRLNGSATDLMAGTKAQTGMIRTAASVQVPTPPTPNEPGSGLEYSMTPSLANWTSTGSDGDMFSKLSLRPPSLGRSCRMVVRPVRASSRVTVRLSRDRDLVLTVGLVRPGSLSTARRVGSAEHQFALHSVIFTCRL